MKVLVEYKANPNGKSFFIPLDKDEFLKDMQQGFHTPKVINEEVEDHDDWYNRTHAFDEVNHIPEML